MRNEKIAVITLGVSKTTENMKIVIRLMKMIAIQTQWLLPFLLIPQIHRFQVILHNLLVGNHHLAKDKQKSKKIHSRKIHSRILLVSKNLLISALLTMKILQEMPLCTVSAWSNQKKMSKKMDKLNDNFSQEQAQMDMYYQTIRY